MEKLSINQGPFSLQIIGGLHGFILDWLVYEPYKVSDACFTALSPEINSEKYKVYHVVNDYAINLNQLCSKRDVYCLAACYLHAETRLDVRIEIGSYDGYQLWLNGVYLADRRTNNQPKLNDNVHTATLEKGTNLLTMEMNSSLRKFYSVRLLTPEREQIKGVQVFTTHPEKNFIFPPILNIKMINPHYSSYQYFNKFLSQRSLLHFKGKTRNDWAKWRKTFKSKIIKLLGNFPEKVSLQPRIVERTEMDGYIREKIIFDSELDASIPSYILMPKNPNSEPKATLLCLHGHGDQRIGKDRWWLQNLFKTEMYPIQYVKRGYITVLLDFRTFGERADPPYPRSDRDPCDASFFTAVMLGKNITPIGLQVWDLIRTLDYLESRHEIDAARIGCVGCSYGGRTTMFLTAVDERIKACVVSGALNCFKERLNTASSCGNQFVPSLLKYGDVPEILSLIAPRPLLFELGMNDPTSPEIYAMDIYEQVRKVYKVLEAEDKLGIDIHLGGHKFNGEKAYTWFDNWL